MDTCYRTSNCIMAIHNRFYTIESGCDSVRSTSIINSFRFKSNQTIKKQNYDKTRNFTTQHQPI